MTTRTWLALGAAAALAAGCGGGLDAVRGNDAGERPKVDAGPLGAHADATVDARTSAVVDARRPDFPDGAIVEVSPDGSLAALAGPLPSCQWPATLAPRAGGPQGYWVARTILACGAIDMGPSPRGAPLVACASNDGVTCAGSDSRDQVEPCVLGCAPDEYAIEIESIDLFPNIPDSGYPYAFLESLGPCAPPSGNVTNALEEIAETPSAFCCPCNADAGVGAVARDAS